MAYKGPEFAPVPVVVKPPNAPGFPLPIEPRAVPGYQSQPYTTDNERISENRTTYQTLLINGTGWDRTFDFSGKAIFLALFSATSGGNPFIQVNMYFDDSTDPIVWFARIDGVSLDLLNNQFYLSNFSFRKVRIVLPNNETASMYVTTFSNAPNIRF